MVILKYLFWPVKKLRFTCGVVKKEQFCAVILKHLLWPVNKPQFTCGFV